MLALVTLADTPISFMHSAMMCSTSRPGTMSLFSRSSNAFSSTPASTKLSRWCATSSTLSLSFLFRCWQRHHAKPTTPPSVSSISSAWKKCLKSSTGNRHRNVIRPQNGTYEVSR